MKWRCALVSELEQAATILLLVLFALRLELRTDNDATLLNISRSGFLI
jgi:hypothetical protein